MIDLRKKDPVADTVKDLLQKEGWDDMVKAAKEKVSSGPKPSGGSGVKQGTRYGGSKQKDEPEKKETQKEEVEQVDEKAPPGFEGTVKAMKKHKEIDNPFALAWSMKKKGYKSHKKADGTAKNEEVEQIDELSKSTLGSYVKGAARDMAASRSLAKDFERDAKSAKKPNTKDINTSLSNKFIKNASKRNAGIGKAVERLTKEEIESVDEALKGNQHKIDKNHNNKIDAQDFRILRKKMKKEETVVEGKTPIDNNVPFEVPYNTTSSPSVKDKSGATHTPMSRVKHLARQAMKKVKKDLGSK